jgi:hypothetical protein
MCDLFLKEENREYWCAKGSEWEWEIEQRLFPFTFGGFTIKPNDENVS